MSKPYDIGPVTVGNDMESMNKSTDSTNYKCQNQSASITRYTSRFPVDFHGWCLKPVFFKSPSQNQPLKTAVFFGAHFQAANFRKKVTKTSNPTKVPLVQAEKCLAPTQRNGRWDEPILESALFFRFYMKNLWVFAGGGFKDFLI